MLGSSIKMHLSTVITAIFMALLVTLGGVLYRAARRSGQALSPAAAAVIGAGLTMATTLALFVFATALNYDPAVGLLWSDVLESFPPVLLIGAFVSVCVAAVFWAIAAMKQSKGGVKPGGCAQLAAEPGVGADSR